MTYSAPLQELLDQVVENSALPEGSNVEIGGLTTDSRTVQPGDLFIAYSGGTSDGRDFLQQAVAAGAVAILYDADGYTPKQDISVPAIAVAGLQFKVGLIAHHFYGQPSTEMQIFGVTGTNGKTTCCYLLTQALSELGLRAAMIGTIGMGELDNLIDSGHTTPDSIAIHRNLAQWRDLGITQVCMEVSSHALEQGRVNGVQFFCSLFTNLSHDHLDYHGDMATYAGAKQRLFREFYSELVITNADDELGAGLIDIANAGFIASFSENPERGDVNLTAVDLQEDGLRLSIQASGELLEVQTPLVGKVNVPNLLLLVTTLLALSTPLQNIRRITALLRPAPGRMELHAAPNQPRVIIDYAHTPDALEKALESVAQHCRGKLWCVFGCGGDRDADKRAIMGAAAERGADYLIITNDNPRSEDPGEIADQIVAGISTKVEIVLDRAQAIEQAVLRAQANDWVLVAGKGHESTQEIAGKVLPFSDREEVMRLLKVAA